MHTFTTRANGFPAIRKKVLQRLLPVFLITLTAGIVFNFYKKSEGEDFMNVIFYYLVGGLCVFCWRIYREISKRRKIYETYSLTIDDFSITREQHNTPSITTYLDNVTEIIKNKDGSFIIKGKQAGELIGVPAQMENYTELEQLLNQIKPVTTNTKALLGMRLRALLFIPMAALLITVNTVENKMVIAAAAPLAAVLVIWNLVTVQRNRNIDHTTKNTSWIMLLVLASIIAVAYMKLTA